MVIKIVLGLLALGLGVWLGLPGKYRQTPAEIEKLMDGPPRRSSRRAKRHFTPMAWVQRHVTPTRPTGRDSARGRFKLKAPGD